MKPQAPDWPTVITQIVATGMTEQDICKHPGIALTLRALRFLQHGVQPLYHRGERLLVLWCERTGLPRGDAPLADVVRGHRKARAPVDRSPQLQNLPVFPMPMQRVDLQGAKKRAPRKVKEAA